MMEQQRIEKDASKKNLSPSSFRRRSEETPQKWWKTVLLRRADGMERHAQATLTRRQPEAAPDTRHGATLCGWKKKQRTTSRHSERLSLCTLCAAACPAAPTHRYRGGDTLEALAARPLSALTLALACLLLLLRGAAAAAAAARSSDRLVVHTQAGSGGSASTRGAGARAARAPSWKKGGRQAARARSAWLHARRVCAAKAHSKGGVKNRVRRPSDEDQT